MTAQVNDVLANTLEEATGNPPAVIRKIYHSFDELPAHYDRLFTHSQSQSFFHSLPWYQNLSATTVNHDERLLLLTAESEHSAPLGILPMRHKYPSRRGLALRTLSSFSNYYTTRFAPILNASIPFKETIAALVFGILASTPSWDVVNLKPLDYDSILFPALVSALRNAGMVVQTYFCHGNWYYPVNDRSYKEYLQSLRSSVRNIALSKNKKLERTGRARVEITTGPEGLETAIQAYEKVYAASWKNQEPYPQFVPGLIRRCAEKGWLRLGIAYVDNEPAAAQLWVIDNGVASIYKIAYDQKFKELSVGSFLMMRMIQQALDVDRVHELDYLSGDDRYKSDWMSHRREQWGILAMNPRTIGGCLAIARHIGGRKIKSAVRKVQQFFSPSSESAQKG
jgi:CelD/BcsL family acetyltransferase involved in cellulose biosynthesis